MKIVYTLLQDLKNNPLRVDRVRATTLDDSKPYLGLAGAQGLFASKEWWRAIIDGDLEVVFFSGTIRRLFIPGMPGDAISEPDFECVSEDGEVRISSRYANDATDLELFQVGKKVKMAYVLDQLKAPRSDGATGYADILLELSIEE
ncbi:hypothetical protein J5226_15685 [Lysobacter sp. K5869]|uniref:hypothetical protein n=1 Tax=Lysobacter sp. K5869 TaxID=2820808 RepID=UPI001C063959|nr:hypothetical protein [Lysobacter sp. K5869]QWP75073.1 hypothetical protein J5226_15685 [Lysobacter sp. K5869]